MQGFFNDIDLKVFSQTGKIKYILNSFVKILEPIDIQKHTQRIWSKNGYFSISYFTFLDCNNIECINKVYIPKKWNINIKIEDAYIIIEGIDFKYKFLYNNIATIQNKFKKIK